MKDKSPWMTIWTEPRATIRKIVFENPKRALWLLAAVYGFSSLLNSFQSVFLGNQLQVLPIIVIALVLSPIWGYIVFSVWSWVVCWTGKLLKGEGNFQHVRAAYAWSCVPLIVNAALWIVLILLFGRPLFSNFPQEHFLTNGEATLMFLILIVKVVLAIWSLVIYLNALAEVQNYSILRAIGNVLIAGILIGVVFAIIWSLSLQAMGVSLEHSNTAFQILNDGKMLETIRGDL